MTKIFNLRPTLAGAVALAFVGSTMGALATAAPAFAGGAGDTWACGASGGNPIGPQGGIVSANYGFTGFAGFVQLCVQTPAIASIPLGSLGGTVTAGGADEGLGGSGYLIADGSSSDPGPTGGYAGAFGSGSSNYSANSVQVVGCSQGYYDPTGPQSYGPSDPNPNYDYEGNAPGHGQIYQYTLNDPADPTGIEDAGTGPCKP